MSTTSDTTTGPQAKRWTNAEYHSLGDIGAFENERVELLDGLIYVKHHGVRKRWTHKQYHNAGDAGLFDGERVELIDGEIYVMSPMSSLHASGIQRVQYALQKVSPDEYLVRVQLPILSATSESEPEPDVSLVRGSLDDFDNAVPSSAALVAEVSTSSLEFDRTRKLSIYARQQIPEYWILNLVDDCLEIFREPDGDSYGNPIVLCKGDSIAPLVIPDASIAVSDLIPKRC